jgi:hypothetical protein
MSDSKHYPQSIELAGSLASQMSVGARTEGPVQIETDEVVRAFIREKIEECSKAIREIIRVNGGSIRGENIRLPGVENWREIEREILGWQALAAELKAQLGE